MLISVHTANSVHDCDQMFIADFLSLDKLVATLQDSKQQNNQQLVDILNQ